MPSDRTVLETLKDFLTDTDRLIPLTSPPVTRERDTDCHRYLRKAIALTDYLLKRQQAVADELLKQPRVTPAAVLGRKGGITTSGRHGIDHYRKMAAARKTRGGGRPRKQAQ